jgi:hypothetical protein
MAKKVKTPPKKAAASKKPATKAKAKVSAPKASKSNVKTAKPAKVAAPKVTAKAATPKATAAKTPVKGELAKKGPAPIAAKKSDKKSKDDKKEQLGFDDGYEDNFDDEVAQYEDLKTKTPEQMEELRALLGEDGGEEVEIALRDAEGRLYCKMRECDELSLVDGYCRFHYLKLWKKIQLRKKILTDGKLEKYIEELTLRYPDKYIEMIRDDLKSEKHFLAAIQELEIEDVNEEATENDEDQGLLEEVRGIQTVGDTDDDSF